MTHSAPAKPILALVGPTAVGKTSISILVAEAQGAEIISADSRQVFRALTIGTAKPSSAELSRVPHHFIGELKLNERYSAGTFAEQANIRISDILARGKVPLIVGGSTLYLQALLHGLSATPPPDPSIRHMLETRLQREGSHVLYRELRAADPALARTLDPTKSQRLIRGLEVYLQTGQPLSSFHARRIPPPYRYDIKVLNRDRERLYSRINLRVERMLEQGLVDEVRTILARGPKHSMPVLRTIGYKEVAAFVAGNTDETEMVRLIKRNTRRYAKRQLTWFRRYPEICWIDLDNPELARLGRWRHDFKSLSEK